MPIFSVSSVWLGSFDYPLGTEFRSASVQKLQIHQASVLLQFPIASKSNFLSGHLLVRSSPHGLVRKKWDMVAERMPIIYGFFFWFVGWGLACFIGGLFVKVVD